MAETNQGVLFCCSKTFLSWRSKPENQTIVRSASDCLQCITYNVLPNYIWLLSTWWGRCDGEEASAGLHTGQNLPWLIRHFIINFSFEIAGRQTNKQTNKQKHGNVSTHTSDSIQTSWENVKKKTKIKDILKLCPRFFSICKKTIHYEIFFWNWGEAN